jgi:MYXO-CTERM domain-containing protein
VVGNFTPVTILSVTSEQGDTAFTYSGGTVTPTTLTSGPDTYDVTAFTSLNSITGIELTVNNGIDNNNFVLSEISGTATAVPEPALLGLSSLAVLGLLRRRSNAPHL